MENFNDIVRALKAVLDTQLLAPSWNALAIKLGIARSIFYRIEEGKANQSAIQNLLSLLQEHLYISPSSLLQMEAAITNTSDFSRFIKPEMNLDSRDWQFKVLLDFIRHDYSHFSPESPTASCKISSISNARTHRLSSICWHTSILTPAA